MFVSSFVFYLFMIVACIGAGYMLWTFVVQRLVPVPSACLYPSSIELGIVGLFAIGIFSVLLNFLVPISQWLSIFIVAVCLIMGIVNLFRKPTPGLLKLLVLAAVIAVFAFWGSKFMLRHDAGLYHLQAISWIKDEPIVIGLANIHDRFGFNSLWFSVLAVFWLPFYEIEGVLLANYLPAIFFIFVLISHLLNPPKSSSASLPISVVFAVFCLASVSAVPFILLTTTTSTDLAPNACTLLSAFIFLRGFESHRRSRAEVTKDHMMLWIIATFAVLTKLVTITPCLLALIFTAYNKDVIGITTVRRTAYFLIGVTGTWLLRNIFLSGCLVFPVGLTCADTDFIQWSVGSDTADRARLMIERWAKAPGADFLINGASAQWFDEWLRNRNRGGQLTRVVSGVVGVSIVVLFYLLVLFISQLLFGSQKSPPFGQKTDNRRSLMGAAWVFLAALGGLLFGFLTAPDPRFWWGPMITLLILPVTLVPYLFFRHSISIGSRSILVIILLAAGLTGRHVVRRGLSWEALTKPMISYRAVIPEIKTALVPGTGFMMRMPVDGNKCWLTPKPCSSTSPEGLTKYHVWHYSVFTRKAGSKSG